MALSKTYSSLDILSCYGTKFNYAEFTKRIRIDIGSVCNCKCEFCYQRGTKRFVRHDVREQIATCASLGFTSFDFSGGEPSVLKNLPEYCGYASHFGQVSCLSNGYGFADAGYLKACVQAGLSEILFSVHSLDPGVYESITHNSFKRLMTGLTLAENAGLKLRLNVTVYSANLPSLKLFKDFVSAHGITQINFIILNRFSHASDFPQQDTYALACALNEVLDDFTVECNVRYAPFCYFPSHVSKVKGYFQHLYDAQDWSMISYRCTLEGLTAQDVPAECVKIARQSRLAHFRHKPECRGCRYFFDCDGVKEWEDPVFPVKDERI